MTKHKTTHMFYSLVSKLKRLPFVWVMLRKIYYAVMPSQERIIEIDGHKLWINPSDKGIGQRLYLQGRYGDARTKLIKEGVKDGNVVLDIGANIGYFTMHLARAVGPTGKVVAIEPDDRNFETLKRNIELNGYTDIIIPVMKAVSNEDKTALFYKTDSQTDNSLVAEEGADTIEVDVVKLDNFLPKLGLDHIDFLKIDTDGSEPLAIQGMKSLIQASPNFKMVAEFTPINLQRYFADPMEFLSVAKDCGLTLDMIIDTETGKLANQNVQVLEELVGEESYDLVFKKTI